MNEPDREEIRWWPAQWMVGLFVVAVIVRSLLGSPDRQGHVLFLLGASLLLAIGLVLWFLLASRASWQRKGVTALVALGAAVFGLSIYEFTGFSGDMMPVFEPRRPPLESLESGEELQGMQSDSPCFRGPKGDGVVPGVQLHPNWKRQQPLLLWRRPVGAAWSTFSVVGESLYTMEQSGENEGLVCYDASNGEERWRNEWPGRFDNAVAGVGPRSTPCVNGGRVVAVGALGHVVCVSALNGKTQWEAELDDYGKGGRRWGYAASPVVHHGEVLLMAGGGGESEALLVALDLVTGTLRWRAGTHAHHYSTPVVTELAGTPQVVVFARNRLLGLPLGPTSTTRHDALWQVDWPEGSQCVAQPVILPGDRVLVSSGYGVGAAVYHIEASQGGLTASEKWSNHKLKAKFSSMVVHEGDVLGLDDGILVRIDPETGERRWKQGRYGHGHLQRVGKFLLIQAESGEVVLVDAMRGFELGRFRALDRRTWNPALLAGNRLFVRNDREAACFLLALQ